ncbi:hypothetical protein E3P99_02712 [Wallemia hederae]|uniref:peptidylprolyl isomerase n=1 Tax=Wallemia hederae TaxID=1540922 RepID=A0A4T0FIU1_9BASI|nr:hypothetical protein E3P99_02712 [Wallemia hederae]
MSALGIWSHKLLPNSPSILEIDDDIHITNVALAESSSSKNRSVVKLTYEPQDDSESDDDESAADNPTQEVVLCSLIPGQVEQVSVNLTLTANDLVSLSVTGNNEVHLLGNLVSPNLPYPQDEDSEDESDLDEDEMRALYGQDVSMDDEDDEDDEEDGPKIEELPDEPIAKPSKKRPAEEAPAKPSKKEKKEAAVAEKKEEPKKAEKKQEKQEKQEDKRVTLPNGVSYKDAKVGDGPVAKSGKRVGMRYIGRVLKDGKPQKKVFDQNTSGKPFSFRVGTGEVISGWDTGVLGAVNGKGGQPMRVGGERVLFIPAKQAYGNQSIPGIGKNADLHFEVKLVEVK